MTAPPLAVVTGVPGALPSTSTTNNGVSLFGSVSLSVTLPVVATFTRVAAESSLASGSSLALGSESGWTLIVTVAVSVAPLESVMVYSKVSKPMKPAVGWYSKVPSELTVTVPPLAVVNSVPAGTPPA